MHLSEGEVNVSPRIQLYATDIYLPKKTYSRVTLIKTDRERQIALGTNYPFAPLKKGQCLVSSYISKAANVTEGDFL